MYILSCIFMIVCAIVLPITLAVTFCVRREANWRPLLLGTLTFVVFQVFIRFPLIRMLLPQLTWYKTLATAYPTLYALLLGGSAALFEEVGRYLVMSLLMKKQRTAEDAIVFGIGHGGIEAIIISGINAVVLFLSSADISTTGMIFSSGVERASTLAIQIAFSVMIMKSVREKKAYWLFLAFAAHTLVDFGAAFASDNVNTWAIEITLAVFAIMISMFTLKEYRKETYK